MAENTTLTQNPPVSSSFTDAFDKFMDDLNVAVASGDFSGFKLGSDSSVVGHNDDSTALQNSTIVHDSTGLLGITIHFFCRVLLIFFFVDLRSGLSSPSAQYSFPESRLRVNRSNRYEPLSLLKFHCLRMHSLTCTCRSSGVTICSLPWLILSGFSPL